MPPPSPLRIGLTGGIASGKSTVSAMLEARGIPVVDADQVYHELIARDGELLGALRDEFGDGVFTADGALDRGALGAVVFSDPEALKRLGEITHPRVRTAMVAAMDGHAGSSPPPPAVVGAIPLLFENGLEALFDVTVVVDVPAQVQLTRLCSRNDLDEDSARARIASQMPLEERRSRADHAVSNAGSREETEAGVEELLATLGLFTAGSM